MIPWKKYESNDRSIESHVPHLVTNGERIELAVHAKSINLDGYGWHVRGGYRITGVTHWSPINLPGEETDNA